LDHPGFNNAYQVNAQTDLSIIYNDNAPLEMHHAAMLFTVLKFKDGNILANVSDALYRYVNGLMG
jgi:high affinity cGMP-specific 3',5'-cyclic phosphodiesterase 9